MKYPSSDFPSTIFSTCRRTLGSDTWGGVLAAMEDGITPDDFPEWLASICGSMALPGFIADLAKLEWALHQTRSSTRDTTHRVETITVNPTLSVIPLRWKHLADWIRDDADATAPKRAESHVILWKHPRTHTIHFRDAEAIDLLVLKLIVEQIDPRKAAALGKATPGEIQNAIDQAVSQGLLLSPDSLVCRESGPTQKTDPCLAPFLCSDGFTLQWHITQACDLHCKHCYDRSDRPSLDEDKALTILGDLFDFCRRMHVRGQVTFTGGNPLLYPHIESVYRAAAAFGFGIAILGNPGPTEPIRRLAAIAKPLYFQISLEGLAAHNDVIRGKGHFDRALRFLKELREMGVFTMVMLTLTRDNIDQVLPLAEHLQGRVDAFNFNRLSTVGEGANLLMPEPSAFESFLREYTRAAKSNPILGLKDNLINLIRREDGDPPFGGCTGHGCGAAFNFVALLPDGEIHACRKFPSLIGNIFDRGLFAIYHDEPARRYRIGGQACRDCNLNAVCRGCLAITHSLGLDVFSDKDPFCFSSPR